MSDSNHSSEKNHMHKKRHKKRPSFSNQIDYKLFTLDTKWIDEPVDLLHTFYLALSIHDRNLWEQFLIECVNSGVWDDSLAIGQLGWEKDVKQGDATYLGFIRRKQDSFKLFIKLDDAIDRFSSDSLIEVPFSAKILADIVWNLRSGKNLGLVYNRITGQVAFYGDGVKRSWQSQILWEVMFADLVKVDKETNQWQLLLPVSYLDIFNQNKRAELLNAVKNRFLAKSVICSVKVINIDHVLLAIIADSESIENITNSEDIFTVSWINFQDYLVSLGINPLKLSLTESAILQQAAIYVVDLFIRILRLVLALNPQKITVLMEDKINTDFGAFRAEADLWYNDSIKIALGNFILESIVLQVHNLTDSRVELIRVAAPNAFTQCSLCGQPFDGRCPHFPRHRICDLSTECHHVIDVAFEVLQKQHEKTVTMPNRSKHRLCEYLVGDETGRVILTVWDEDIEQIEIGKVYLLKGGTCKLYHAEYRLVRGMGVFLLLPDMPWVVGNRDT